MNETIFPSFKKFGRDADFKCIICGKFVSYDKRKTDIDFVIEEKFDSSQEQWYPEEKMYCKHKKCHK